MTEAANATVPSQQPNNCLSELTGLRCRDLEQPDLNTVRVMGKGRRERVLARRKETRTLLQEWLATRPDKGAEHLFLNARGTGMTRHGFAHRLQVHAEIARQRVPSMAEKAYLTSCSET